jgi:alcohol dehydrogenase
MNNMQTIQSGLGSSENLREVLKIYGASRILAVTGRRSFESSGAKIRLADALQDFQVTYFDDFSPNPKLDDAKRGAKLIYEHGIELIISVGGGSVMDMAKLIKAFSSNMENADSIAKGLTIVGNVAIPIIAIPTTAGSGSESTHFAVVYIREEKFSVANKILLPNYVILDAHLTLSATKYQKACNVLDAISQSIESSWAVGATPESQKLSYAALTLCMGSFQEYVNSSSSIDISQSMIEAANLAGQAINISKTTAAHAWSYGISAYCDIPHGHAVWATLPRIFELHCSSSELELNDPRGSAYLSETMRTLKNIMGISDSESLIKYFDELLHSIGIDKRLGEHIAVSKSVRKMLSEKVNQQRMGNNPVAFKDRQLQYIFDL